MNKLRWLSWIKLFHLSSVSISQSSAIARCIWEPMGSGATDLNLTVVRQIKLYKICFCLTLFQNDTVHPLPEVHCANLNRNARCVSEADRRGQPADWFNCATYTESVKLIYSFIMLIDRHWIDMQYILGLFHICNLVKLVGLLSNLGVCLAVGFLRQPLVTCMWLPLCSGRRAEELLLCHSCNKADESMIKLAGNCFHVFASPCILSQSGTPTVRSVFRANNLEFGQNSLRWRRRWRLWDKPLAIGMNMI